MSVGVLVRPGAGAGVVALTLQELIPTLVPLGYWPLDDTVGTTIRDLGPAGHNGTWTGAPARAQAALLPGASPCAVLSGTPGAPQYGTLGAVLNPAAGAMSFHLICKDLTQNAGPNLSGLFTASVAMVVGCVASGGGIGTLSWAYYLGGWHNLGAAPAVIGTAYQWIGTYDPAVAGNSFLVRSGVLRGANMAGGGTGATTAPADLFVGRRWDDPTSVYAGSISDVAVWDRALTLREIAALWATVAP